MKLLYNLLFFVSVLTTFSISADKKLDVLIEKKDYDHIVKYIELEYEGSKDKNIIYNLAFANEQMGFYEKSIASYLVLYNLNFFDPVVVFSLARSYFKLGFYEKAFIYSQKCLEIDSLNVDYKLQYANICLKIDKYDEARKIFETLKSTEEAKKVLAILYYQNKQYRQAIPFLLDRYKFEKQDSIAIKLAFCYEVENKIDSALFFLKSINNISIDNKLRLARFYSKLSQCDKAFLEYKNLQIQIFEYQDFYIQAECSEKMGNFVRALAFYETALQKTKDLQQEKKIKFKILKIYVENKDFKSASKYIKEFELQDKTVEFYKLAIQYYNFVKDYEKVSYYLNKFLQIDSTNVSMYFMLMETYKLQGMLVKSKQVFDKISKFKNTSENLLQLAEYYFEDKEFDKALEFYEKTYIMSEKLSVLEKIAICSYNLKDFDKAKDASETLFRKNFVSDKCREILYKIALDKKEYITAIEHLEILIQENKKIEVYKDLSRCYKQTNNNKKLIELDEKIIEFDSRNIESRERLIVSYILENKNLQALQLFYSLEQIRNFSVKDYFKIVSLLEKTNNDTVSVLYLKKIITVEPINIEAHKKLGDIKFKWKKNDEAYLEYNKVMFLDESRVDYLKNFCYVVIEKKNIEEIIKVCNKAKLSNNVNDYILLNLANTYYNVLDFSKALQIYLKLPQEKIDVKSLLRLAICQEKLNLTSDAILSYEQYINLVEDAKVEYLSLANLYLKIGKKEQEIAIYKVYLKKYKDESLFLIVAKYEYENKRYESAIKYFSEVNMSNNFEGLFIFSRSLFMMKKYDDVISVLVPCEKLTTFSKLTDVFYMLAVSHENLKNTENSIRYYKLYIQKKSNDSTICFHIGELQEKLHVNLAKDIYLANVKKFPNDSRNFLRLSEIFYKFGDFKRAKIALEQVKRIEGDVSIEILSRLACCYKENNERNKEIAIYKEVLIKDNTNFTANKFLGIYCYESGEISEGLSYLELAKSQNYNDPDMLYILGKIYLKDKFSNEGLMFLQSAKKQKNNDIKIRMLIIETYKKYLKLKEALIEIESLLKIDRSFKNLDLYAKTLFENKNYNVAENIALELRKREPRNIDLMMFLVQIKIEQNLFDDALEYCKMISYVDSRYGPALCKRGDIYALKQDVEKAKEFYLKAIKSSPKYALSFYKLAMIYKYSGDVDLYIYNITKAAELDSTEVLINEELKKIQVKKN